jgi:hypothetical protein
MATLSPSRAAAWRLTAAAPPSPPAERTASAASWTTGRSRQHRRQGESHLILDGATLTCADNAPIYVVQADKVVITLADGSTNVVSDGATYNAEAVAADEPDAAIFSKADLTLNGGGALVVNATYNHGIVSKDDLKITGGTITVNAVNDGVKGRDSVAVKDGALTINAGGDGLQANNDEDAEKGVIAIEGGVLVITAGQDAVQAETQLQVSGGELTLTTGGGSANARSAAVGTIAGWVPPPPPTPPAPRG